MKRELHKKIYGLLASFQKEGVVTLLKRQGRGLIADEMGLGKTIQGIAVASAYSKEWPLLILCPSSARFHWEAELCKFLIIDKSDILVVCKAAEMWI